MNDMRPRSVRRAAAKDLWRKTRRQARNQQNLSSNTLWQLLNDEAAELRFVTQRKRKAQTNAHQTPA